jgi:hypothetical protein
MTPDEMQRTMEFILEQQASLAAKTDANTDAIARLTEAQTGLTASQAALTGVIESIGIETRDAITTMLGIAESMSENVRVLTALQIDTRSRLDALEGNKPGGPNGTGGA